MATLPYSGGSRTNIPGPGAASPGAAGEPVRKQGKPVSRETSRQEAPQTPPASRNRDDSDVDERDDERPAESRGRPRGGSLPRVRLSAGSIRGDASGVVLALVLWGWVVLPFLGVSFDGKTSVSGLQGVADVWRAKFLNKGPDGAWLA